MLTDEGCRARRRRLFDALGEDVDLLIVGDPQHLVYLAGYYPSPFEYRTVNAAAFLLVERGGAAVLVGDGALAVDAERAHCDERVMPAWYRGIDSAPVRRAHLIDAVLGRLRKMPGNRMGYEPGAIPAAIIDALRQERGKLALTDICPTLHRLKRRKDADELATMKRAIRAAEAGFAAALADVRPGMTELDVFTLVQVAVQEGAGQQIAIYGDFVSGVRTGDVGGPPSLRTIDAGDLVLVDFSAVVCGYRGDFANTFCCGRPPTDRQRQLYQACLEALQAAEAILAPGVKGRDIDAAVKASFAARGLVERFTSHSGHGIGLGHPDPPYLVRESGDALEVGDIVAVEPGLYFPGEFGMRYERNYRIIDDGCETLSHHALQIEQR